MRRIQRDDKEVSTSVVKKINKCVRNLSMESTLEDHAFFGSSIENYYILDNESIKFKLDAHIKASASLNKLKKQFKKYGTCKIEIEEANGFFKCYNFYGNIKK